MGGVEGCCRGGVGGRVWNGGGGLDGIWGAWCA